MKKFYLSVVVLAAILICPAEICGQGDSYKQKPDKAYEERASKLREEVWAWDIPAFKNHSVPEEYAGESAVILARHKEIDATAKKTSFAKEFFLGDKTGKLFYTDTDRRMVRINDQSALDEYSEFSFKETDIKYSYSAKINTVMTIVGARIIKPDGTVKEVDVSDYAVSVTEGKKDREAYKKLAIPELQKGDILDYFVCEVYELTSYNLPQQFVPFFSADYPGLNYSCRLEFGKNLTIEYRSINGAPGFEKTTGENGNIILTAEQPVVPRINDLDNIRWISPYRDLPMIRLMVLQNASKAFVKPKSARSVGIHENVSYELILEDAKEYLPYYIPRLTAIKNVKKKVSKVIDNYKKTSSGMSDAELADIIYTALNFEWVGYTYGYYYNQATFILTLDQLMKDYGLDCKIGFITNKYGARKDEVVNDDDLEYILTANNDSQIFYSPYWLRVAGENKPLLQGETASLINIRGTRTMPAGTLTVPGSEAGDNTNITRMNVSFSGDDLRELTFKRNSVWRGALKDDMQPLLVTLEDWDSAIRRYLRIEKGLIEELDGKRATRKLGDELKGRFEKDRSEFSETVKQEVSGFHEKEAKEIIGFSLVSAGVVKDSPDLEYNVDYVMEDFVRSAGENIILDAGKLIGIQWDPTDNDRNRGIDAYLPTARMFENVITVRLPDGYSAGDISHLNVNYSNDYASFEAVTSVSGDLLTIKAKKIYHKSFIPKQDWHELIDIMDKTNTFYSASLILKKTR